MEQDLKRTDKEATESRDVAQRIEEISPIDAASIMTDLPAQQAANVAEYLDPTTAASILSNMDAALAATVISDMEMPEASVLLEKMDPDDRVDILAHVTGPLHDELVGEMNEEHADEVRQLEQYSPDTAGGIMTTEVTALYEYITVDDAITLLKRLNEELEQMFYVYVIDRRKHLVGVLSMRDLILARPDKRLRDIMIPNVRSVPATMDQEHVANLMRKYRYLAMPVVDADKKLIGLITLDDIVQVMQDEATEDVQKMFGAGAEERLTSPWHLSFRKRVVWLEVNLATAFAAAGVVSFFTDTIAALPILAAYQTIVSGMGGNAGAQAMAVAIRGIAVGEAQGDVLKKVLRREFMVGLCSGLVIGITTAIIAMVFNRSQQGILVGVVVCIALILNHINACVTGVTVPFVMKRLGFDPAQSATIFATTFTDCGGFFACLGLAKIAIAYLGIHA
ncbi:MAG TPA: magnesium transporter [Tepidisphaeraceae bacterium]|nr:magnesium transporter [Tepidisphaeraceae bacterium]